jgi:hypothetical protein
MTKTEHIDHPWFVQLGKVFLLFTERLQNKLNFSSLSVRAPQGAGVFITGTNSGYPNVEREGPEDPLRERFETVRLVIAGIVFVLLCIVWYL